MSWKDHPLVIAATTCAATALFFLQFVSPVLTKERDNEIAGLKQQIQARVDTQGAADKKVASLELQLSKAASDAAQLQARVRVLSQENLFSSDDVYPKGIGRSALVIPLLKSIRCMRASRSARKMMGFGA